MRKSKRSVIMMVFMAVFFCQRCTLVEITVSDLRNPQPQSITLEEHVKITTWGAIKVNKSDFFPSSFQILSGDKVLYIDPVEIFAHEKADYIFLTHAHPDHLSLTTIEQLAKPETTFICPRNVTKKLRKKNYKIMEVTPGQVVELEDIRCETVAEYNTRSVLLWMKAHPRSQQNVGYLLTLQNGLRVYHAGDTDYIPEMKMLTDINVALVPIGGDNLTMTATEASRLMNEIRPEIAIPMHYELEDEESLNDFRRLTDDSIRIRILE